jgi:uncharacterized membrane protein
MGAVQLKIMFFFNILSIFLQTSTRYQQNERKKYQRFLKFLQKVPKIDALNESINQLVLQGQKFRQIFLFLSLYEAPPRHC